MAKRQSQGSVELSDQDGPETSRPVFFHRTEFIMEDVSLARIQSTLRQQQDALAELIEIALAAVKESGDSSVSAIHLSTRLQKLSDVLKRENVIKTAPPAPNGGR
jgi:hypothetical protein